MTVISRTLRFSSQNRQGQDIWNLSKFKHNLVAPIREECHSFFFVLGRELEIEPQCFLRPMRHLDRFLNDDSDMRDFILFHRLLVSFV